MKIIVRRKFNKTNDIFNGDFSASLYFSLPFQIPQMILDDAKEKKRVCNIVVTQPRRIAARSIAERVSRERGWELGSVVGYQVKIEHPISLEISCEIHILSRFYGELSINLKTNHTICVK